MSSRGERAAERSVGCREERVRARLVRSEQSEPTAERRRQETTARR